MILEEINTPPEYVLTTRFNENDSQIGYEIRNNEFLDFNFGNFLFSNFHISTNEYFSCVREYYNIHYFNKKKYLTSNIR